MRKRVITLVYCIGIAILLWVTVQLRKTYTITMQLPILYTNLATANIIKHKLPYSILATVSGTGLHLLKYQLKPSLATIQIDLETINPSNKSKEKTYISTKVLIEHLTKEHKNISIQSLNPDTLFFQSTHSASKTVPIVPLVKIIEDKTYTLEKNITCIPSQINIRGPSAILDTLQAIYSYPIDYKASDTSKQALLQLPNEEIVLPINSIKVVAKLAALTEDDFTASIHLPSKNYWVSPSEVQIHYSVLQKDYNPTILQNATIELQNIQNGKAIPVWKNMPASIQKYSIYPAVITVYKKE